MKMLMSEEVKLTIGTQVINCTGGDCKSFNLIYCEQCTSCNKAYIGKTTQLRGRRIIQHRHRNTIATLSSNVFINEHEIDDANTLAAHCMHRA